MHKLEKYSSYKDSGVDWLGEIPEEWKFRSLKYDLSFTVGGTPSSHVSGFYDGDEPWVTIADMNGRYIEHTHFIAKSGVYATSMSLVPKGSLLYSFKLSVGQVAFINQNLYTNEAIASFHPTEKVNLKYWYYSLPIFIIKNANTNIYGAYILNQDLIKNAKLVLPPKEEQTKIANFLDKKTAQIDEAIKQKEELISLLKERRQVLIHKAVTQGLDATVKMKDSGVEWLGEVPEHWEAKALKFLLEERNERSETGEETLFMMSQVHGLVVRADYHDKAVVAHSSVGNKKVYKNDLVFNKLKAHLGVFSKSNIDDVGIVSPDYAVYFPIADIRDVKYLELLFKNPIYISHFIRKATGIVEGLIRLYTDDLFSLKVPVPPESEQKEILAYVDKISIKIDTAIYFQEKEIEKIKEYKVTLIDSVVTGKVRVV